MDMNNENMMFKINPKRLHYVLDLYNLSNEEFISLLNKNKKRKVLTLDELNQIIGQQKDVDVALLRKFDKIFEKGLTWYISKRDLPDNKSSSIFFRKESFNSDLDLDSKKMINTFEELKFEIQTLCRFIEYTPEKKLQKYQISNNSKDTAREIKEKFSDIENKLINNNMIQKPKADSKDRDYLRNLIRIIEEFNIFVFEFIDKKRLEEKRVNFNGFFMNPNIIVIKRQQEYLRREIFTLLHEFAHCLINDEEIDKKVGEEFIVNPNDIEKWCNNFTYYFLIGEYDSEIEKLNYASEKNDFLKNEINNLYSKTYLSTSALYTQLRIKNKISSNDYNKIIEEINLNVTEKISRQKEKIKLEKERLKDKGEKLFISSPKPISSNLFKEIVKINYFKDNINENILRDYSKKLGIMSFKNISEETY